MMKNLFLALGLLGCTIPGLAQEKIKAETLEKVIAKPSAQILDVRTPQEFADGHIPNAVNVDWKDQANFKKQLAGLKKNEPVYVYCLGGGRSKQASEFLTAQGYQVFDYSGGMMDWRSTEKPEIKPNKGKADKGMNMADYTHLTKSDKVVLVNFSAVWCAPCQQLKPILEKVEKEQKGKVKVVRLDADKNNQLMKDLKVSAIPVVKIYKNGQEVWTYSGVATEQELVKQINKAAK